MIVTIAKRTLWCASLAAMASAIALPAHAADDPAPADDHRDDILVTAQRQQQTIENAPSTRASIDADTIARTVNAMNVEDTIKYLPSLIVRKRHIGDTQAPLATRTAGPRQRTQPDLCRRRVALGVDRQQQHLGEPTLERGQSAGDRADRCALWAVFGGLSGQFDRRGGQYHHAPARRTRGDGDRGVSVQTYDLYGRRDTYPAYQAGVTIGDRFGPLALFASYDRVTSRSQPIGYVTGAAGLGVVGAIPDRNRTGQPITILGSSGIERRGQDRLKLKAALDLSSDIRLTYVGGLFLNRTDASAESYLTATATGLPVYPSASFASGTYSSRQRHWSHAVSLGGSGGGFDWQVIGTRYRFADDEQRAPTSTLPAALSGGAGNVTRLDGTGWDTLDAKSAWSRGGNVLSAGAHWDRFVLASNRYATTDWIKGTDGVLNQQSLGKTRTAALWAQDALDLLPRLTLTLGGRYEWWRAYDGENFSTLPAVAKVQPTRSANRFSPKASLAWKPSDKWKVQLSYGDAWRFPTVGELYQLVTSGVLGAIPNPDLKPEHARSTEFAIERTDAKGSVRLSLFNEVVTDALISQTGTITAVGGGTLTANFVQNVDRTRARGVELAVVRNDLIPRVDLSGSVTYADATTRADPALPAAVGKLIPTVPRWKANAVATWRPVDGVSLSAAARYSSRMYGQLDNKDVVGNTYQGFYKFFVVDLRAQFVVAKKYVLGLGVDNVNNDKYFLFHPFPQRSVHADLTIKL